MPPFPAVLSFNGTLIVSAFQSFFFKEQKNVFYSSVVDVFSYGLGASVHRTPARSGTGHVPPERIKYRADVWN